MMKYLRVVGLGLAMSGGGYGIAGSAAPGGRLLDSVAPAVMVNQLGFLPGAPKVAAVTGMGSAPFYVVSDERKDTVFRGKLSALRQSANSFLRVSLADFSRLQSPGVYRVVVAGAGSSAPFRIGQDVLRPLAVAALKGYYYQRSGMGLDPVFAGAWKRDAGHPDTAVLVHPSAAGPGRSAGTLIATPGGWYDAGDYNKYIVNSGITMGTLLDALEDFPDYYGSLKTNIPPDGVELRAGKAGNLPDLLREILYNLRWMLTMQDPVDGGVYNKCTNANFDGMVMPELARLPRFVVQKGTAATLDFAAVMAQAGRVLQHYKEVLPGLSDSCLGAARQAWGWAIGHPAVAYDQDSINRGFVPKIVTGGYGDQEFRDEWFWAGAELAVNAALGLDAQRGAGKDSSCLQVISKYMRDGLVLPAWADVHMMGVYSLLRYRKALGPGWQGEVGGLEKRLLALADEYLARAAMNPWKMVMGASPHDFIWGSNSNAANQGVLLVYAWKLSGKKKYLDHAWGNMNYLLGENATGYCFVTGMGSHSPMHPHHRISIADGIVEPVPGLLAGGPNPGRQDGQRYRYADAELAYEDQDQAYASNEIAINWNAPLVYLAGALDALQGAYR